MHALATQTEQPGRSPTVEPGMRLGQYEVVSRLSSGGMASLYLARRRGVAGFSRHVAIKVVHPHLAENPHFVRMFVDEAKLAVQIQHPNVVHVEELGEANGTYYIVMEYVHGCSLAQLLAALAKLGRRLTPELSVWIAIRIAEGLHAAHEITDETGRFLGVVHRDVSPQNILVAASGHIKLIDFGIAKAYGRQYQTVQGSLKGKLKYMAPEQARSSKVDRRTDIYALGIVLWEMLTMRRLFRGDNELELLEKVRSPSIEPPGNYFREIAMPLEDAVMRALQRDPEQRFGSAVELSRALVSSVPQAASVDASLMADLLATVLGKELEQKSEMLPRSVTGSVRAPAPVRRGDALSMANGNATTDHAAAAEGGLLTRSAVLDLCTKPEKKFASAAYWPVELGELTEHHLVSKSSSHAAPANSAAQTPPLVLPTIKRSRRWMLPLTVCVAAIAVAYLGLQAWLAERVDPWSTSTAATVPKQRRVLPRRNVVTQPIEPTAAPTVESTPSTEPASMPEPMADLPALPELPRRSVKAHSLRRRHSSPKAAPAATPPAHEIAKKASKKSPQSIVDEAPIFDDQEF